ncbi:MAG: hypothetical protein U1F57_07675 [bacterium]
MRSILIRFAALLGLGFLLFTSPIFGCGERPPGADFGPSQLNGALQIQQDDISLYSFIQFFNERPASCYDPADEGTIYCDILPDSFVDEVSVDYNIEYLQGPVPSSPDLFFTVDNVDRLFYFLFNPPVPGTYQFKVKTSVHLVDEGISNDEHAEKILQINVQNPVSPSGIQITKTFSQLPSLITPLPPPLFAKVAGSYDNFYPNMEMLEGIVDSASVYLQNGRLVLSFHGVTYSTPFYTPEEGFFWSAVAREAGDTVDSLYVMVTNTSGAGLLYFKLTLVP